MSRSLTVLTAMSLTALSLTVLTACGGDEVTPEHEATTAGASSAPSQAAADQDPAGSPATITPKDKPSNQATESTAGATADTGASSGSKVLAHPYAVKVRDGELGEGSGKELFLSAIGEADPAMKTIDQDAAVTSGQEFCTAFKENPTFLTRTDHMYAASLTLNLRPEQQGPILLGAAAGAFCPDQVDILVTNKF